MLLVDPRAGDRQDFGRTVQLGGLAFGPIMHDLTKRTTLCTVGVRGLNIARDVPASWRNNGEH